MAIGAFSPYTLCTAIPYSTAAPTQTYALTPIISGGPQPNALMVTNPNQNNLVFLAWANDPLSPLTFAQVPTVGSPFQVYPIVNPSQIVIGNFPPTPYLCAISLTGSGVIYVIAGEGL